jgi:D-glycero-alpha-D-manno-heptose 1-phosphate guanylyltransferase
VILVSNATNTAVVLAGGLGTRLRSVVADVPKPMAPIGGRPFLEHLFDYWIGEGISRFVLSLGHRAEIIQRHFGDRYRTASIAYAVEEAPLGTGGGLLGAARSFRATSPFLVLNGDTLFAVRRNALDAFADAADADWCFSLFRADMEGRYMSVELAEDGRVRAAGAAKASRGCLANGGVYRVHPRALDPFTDLVGAVSLEDDLFPRAVSLGQRLFGSVSAGAFIDIGVPEDYARAASLLAAADARRPT